MILLLLLLLLLLSFTVTSTEGLTANVLQPLNKLELILLLETIVQT